MEKRGILSRLEELKVKADRDLLLVEEHLASKALEVPKLYHFYLTEFTSHSQVLKVKKAELERAFGEKVKYYKEEYDRELRMSEVEKYVFTDPKYYNMYLEIGDLEVLCRYLEDILKRVNALPYDIKNYIDLRRFFAGA